MGQAHLQPRRQAPRAGNVRRAERFDEHKHKSLAEADRSRDSAAQPKNGNQRLKKNEKKSEKKNVQLSFFTPALLTF